MLIYTYELSRKYTSCVDVWCEWLERLVVAENLAGAGCRHWCNEKTIASTMLHHIAAKLIPVISACVRLYVPKIELEFALRKWGTGETWVRSLYLGDFTWRFHSRMVDRLEDLIVDILSLFIFECDTHLLESICKALHSYTDRPVS